MSRLQLSEGILYRRELGVGVHSRVQGGGDVLSATMHTLHVLQQADHFCDGLREWVVQLFRDRRDFRPHLGADIALDEVINLVQAGKGADRVVGEIHRGINQQLLGELDDGAVGSSDVLASTALGPHPRHDVDDQIDLVRQQSVQVDERFTSELRESYVSRESRVFREATTMLLKQLAQCRLCSGILRKYPTACNLRNIGWLKMHLQLSREPIHEPSELDFLVVEPTDYVTELLLRRHHDPVFAATLYAKTLHNGLKVEHLLHVASDELTHFVDYEHQRVPRSPSLDELAYALRKLAR